jgi:hypothetical protein
MPTARTPIADLNFEKNESLLHIQMREGAEMNLVNTREHYKQIRELTEGTKYVALIDSTHYFSIEADAFEFASSLEATQYRVAAAHYSCAFANRLNANFFRLRYKPNVALNVFETEEDARSWLSTFIPISESAK